MRDTIESTLAQYGTDGDVIGELHAVPPYRVYEVRIDGRRAVLKVDDHPRGHAAVEGRTQAYVAANTSAPVPAVLGVGEDHYLTAWHPAIERASEEVDPAWARAAGGWLGTLHADTAGDFEGYGRIRADDGGLESAGHDDWVEAVRERVAYHRAFLDPIGYADVADAVDRFFGDHPGAFEGVGEPVLCHGDVHPEHHVRTDRGVVGIDFEHALVAPPGYDYWRTVMPYFEADEDIGEAVQRAFREGYESVRPLPDGLERRRSAYRILNRVAFLESLYLQKTTPPERREKMGEWLRRRVFEAVEELREAVE